MSLFYSYWSTNTKLLWYRSICVLLILIEEHLFPDTFQCAYSKYSKLNAKPDTNMPLRWRHNGRNSVSNHQPYDCLLNRLFRRRSKKTSKLRVTGLCVGNSPGTGELPAQMASNAENVSIWWRHHALSITACKSRAICLHRYHVRNLQPYQNIDLDDIPNW